MKAMTLLKSGSLDHLQLQTQEMPSPKAGEVLVRVHAAGLNPVDYKLAQNGHPDWTYPFILGLDVAGEIAALGEKVQGWQIGERVVYHGNLAKPGGFAEYAVTTAHTIARIPDDLAYEQAAAFPCAGLTAYQALHRKIDLRPMRSILIHGGAGGVGGYALQLARQAGLQVLTTCSAKNQKWVQKLGADVAIDYHHEDVSARVQAVTDGRGVDAVINTIGPEQAEQDLHRLAFGGHLVCIAGVPNLAKTDLRDQALSVHTIALGKAHAAGDRFAQEDLARMATEFARLLAAKKIDPMLTETITMAGIPAALRKLAERHVRGKIVALF